MKLSHRFLSFVLALSVLAIILPVSHQYAQAADTQVVDVTMYIGQINTLTDSGGAYDTYTSTGNNVSVALSPSTTYLLGDSVTSLEDNQKYYIKNTRSNDMLTGDTHTSGGLVTSGSTDSLPPNALWQISSNASTNNTMYALFQEGGKHLVLTDGGCNLTGQSTNLYLEYQSGGYWHIQDGTYGLNDYGNNQGRAAGYGRLDEGSQWIFYKAISQGATEITFTAFSPGSTAVTVGNTVYNVTVLAHPDVPTLDSTPIVNSADSSQKITALTISEGFSLVNLDIADSFLSGDSVTWSSSNDNVVTVNEDGVVTGVATGTANIIATIDGQTFSVSVNVLPYSGTNTSSYRTYNAYIDQLYNCAAYYSLDCSDALVSVKAGELVYIQTPLSQYSSIDFFGKPLDGYALNKMGATNANNEYDAINSDIASSTDLYTQNPGIENQISLYGETVVQNMITSAIALKCQGGLTFTRKVNEGNMSTSLSFIAERLPTIQKEVVGILGSSGLASDYRPYVPGMTAKVGEVVWFRITVTNYATVGEPITYSDATISDTLSGGKLINVNYDATTGKWENTEDKDQVTINGDTITKIITGDLNAEITQDTVYRYIISYEIQAKDLESTITNTASLSYSYQSEYNSASFTQDATAAAQITATAFPPKHIVLDFGLPSTVYFDDWGAAKTLESGTASFGTVDIQTVYKENGSTVAGWNVTYTPTQVLQETDTVFLESSDGTLYSLYVYPTTTVYYEEGFATYSGFTGGSKGNGSQQGSFVGDKVFYGFDSKYTNETIGPSNGTQAVSSAFGDTAEFVFTGTGVEIYGNCDPNSDRMVVVITNSAGKLVKFYQVHTNTGGGSDITKPQNNITGYSLPLVSVLDLPHDTYTVSVNHAKRTVDDTESDAQDGLRIDGFRVHGTLDLSSAPYVSDGEANPQYLQLRDAVLHVAQVPDQASGSHYIPVNDTSKTIVDQVYSAAGTTFGAVYTTSNSYNLTDLLDNGPKNELYLYSSGDTLTFKLTEGIDAAQIGLKAVNGETSYSISVNKTNVTSTDMKTCTDMFYKLALTEDQENVITITNTGSNVLSITLLKYFTDGENDNSEATPALAALTAEDVSVALYAMGYEDTQAPVEPVKPVNPFVDVGENSRFKDAILWAYSEGITSGKTATTFEPNAQVTRAQFVTFLWRAAGEPKPPSEENPFEDVSENSRFYEPILWAYHEGITSGKTATTFCPNDVCTRGQVVMFLYRYVGSPDVSDAENPFEDVTEGNRFYNAILWAYLEGITSGKTETTFEINGPCTRAQVVTFLYRLLG